jgi:hypothetical protein
MVDHDTFHFARRRPFLQDSGHGMDHIERQRMDRRWTVQADNSGLALNPCQNFIGHQRNKSRPIIIRIT